MAKSFVDLVRSNLRNGANFLGAAECSRIMATLTAPITDEGQLEDWGIALENMYHALLSLLAARASLRAQTPVQSELVQSASQGLEGGILLRNVLDDFATGADRRLARMSVASRIALISVLLDELRAVYRDLAYEQKDWSVDPEAMREVHASLQGIALGIGRKEIGSRIRFTPAPRNRSASI